MKNYTQQFEKTVYDFIKRGGLLTPDVVVAVSGGLDSISLGFLASKLLEKGMIQSLSFLHIDHQTRKACKTEKELVRKLARKWGAVFISFQIDGLNLEDSSFEKKARDGRRLIFENVSSEHNTRIWCAHHLDDSFEWSLKQRLSSSVFKRQYGIPYKTPSVSRPFMSVSKDQITKYAKYNHLNWKEDLSNNDTRFERGYLREFIIPNIKKRYPQYLKHYVRQMQKESLNYLFNEQYSYHGIYCWPHSEVPHQRVQKSIAHFSEQDRGKLTDQIQKIEKMLQNGKPGPMDMSGGVKLFNLSHQVIITKPIAVTQFLAGLFGLEAKSQICNANELKELIFTNKDNLTSLWLALDDEIDIKSFKGGHPLLPLNLRDCCIAKSKFLVSSWKVLRHLLMKPSKKIKITSIVQID